MNLWLRLVACSSRRCGGRGSSRLSAFAAALHRHAARSRHVHAHEQRPLLDADGSRPDRPHPPDGPLAHRAEAPLDAGRDRRADPLPAGALAVPAVDPRDARARPGRDPPRNRAPDDREGRPVAAIALVQTGLYDRAAGAFVPAEDLLQLSGAAAESPPLRADVVAFIAAEDALKAMMRDERAGLSPDPGGSTEPRA